MFSLESDQLVAQGLHVVRAGMDLKVPSKAVANKTLLDDVAASVKSAVSSHANQEPALSEARCVKFCVRNGKKIKTLTASLCGPACRS